MNKCLRLFALVASFVAMAPALAETAYVTDKFEITMRNGMGSQHKILRMLPTGKAMEVLERNDEEGYSLVRLDDGTEGWVLNRYLQSQPVAKDRLAATETRMKNLRNSSGELKGDLSELRKQNQALEKENSGLSKAKAKLEKELATLRKVAADEVTIYEENKSLKSHVLVLERDVDSLKQENSSLKDRSARDWFLVGAAVCLAGIILGLVLPRLKFRRRSGWGDL